MDGLLDLQQKDFCQTPSELSLTSTQTVNIKSPRHLQRKPELKNFERKKRPTQKNFRADFCYISPVRDFKDKGQVRFDLPNQSFDMFLLENKIKLDKKQIVKPKSVLVPQFPQTFPKNGFGGTPVNRSNKNHKTQVQDGTLIGQIKLRNQSKQKEIKQLKRQNKILKQQIMLIKKQKQQIKRQLSINSKILLDKSKQNQNLKQYNNNLNMLLDNQKKNKKNKQQLNFYLQQVITKLNKKIDQLLLTNIIKNQKLSQFNQSNSNVNQKIQSLQSHIVKINQILKYQQIENRILTKKNHQLLLIQEEMKKLSKQNKRLQNKVDDLERIKHKFLNNNYRIKDQIFQLSPQRD